MYITKSSTGTDLKDFEEFFDTENKKLNSINYIIQTPKKVSPCESCSNNPKNGGSGVCLCTLGLIPITY